MVQSSKGSVQGGSAMVQSMVQALVYVTELEQNRLKPGPNHGLVRANGAGICPKWMTNQSFPAPRLMNNTHIRYLLVVTSLIILLIPLLFHYHLVFPQ